MVILVKIITWHDNNVFVQAYTLLLYQHNSNVAMWYRNKYFDSLKFYLELCNTPLYNPW